MRQVADADRIRRFMGALAKEADQPAGVYFTGGETAVLYGWRASTIDVDLRIVPEHDRLFRAIPRLKETLQVNVELASSADFIPVRPGWEDRSVFTTEDGAPKADRSVHRVGVLRWHRAGSVPLPCR